MYNYLHIMVNGNKIPVGYLMAELACAVCIGIVLGNCGGQ